MGMDMGKPALAADQDKFVLRLPNGMRERIKQVADANNRSMNAEIVATLEKEYPSKFTLKVFMDRWMAPISELNDRSLQEDLVAQANEALQASNSKMFVWLESERDNQPYRVLVGDTPGPLIRERHSGRIAAEERARAALADAQETNSEAKKPVIVSRHKRRIRLD